MTSQPLPHLNMHMKINEIITVDALVQPTPEQLHNMIKHVQTTYGQDVYYHKQGTDLTVVKKTTDKVWGLIMGVSYHQPKFDKIPKFIVPENLYSWVKDSGATALELVQTMIKLSDLPVVSDINMTPQAKRFLQKQIDARTLNARTLDLDTGEVSVYDESIWHQDDDHRVLILHQPFGKPMNSHPQHIQECVWNHAHVLHRLNKL